MDAELGSPSPAVDQVPAHGYPRDAVDEFLAAADAERARLEAVIREASGRAERARAPIGAQRLMMSMLLDTQRELSELRDSAATRAEKIIAEAEAQAREIVMLADPVPTPRPGFTTGPRPGGTGAASSSSTDRPIDLVGAEAADQKPPPDSFGAGSDGPRVNGHSKSTESDEFFDFLRGALADDQPLGPRAE